MRTEQNSPKAGYAFLAVTAALATLLRLATCSALASDKVDPPPPTADLPSSWLVLYNLDNPDSVLWATWYQEAWAIPESNMLGLHASADEHLPDQAAVEAQIIGPVLTYFDANPDLLDSVMGIILGYGLPGHYGQPPAQPDVGGFSIADALHDMTDENKPPAYQRESNQDNPHYFGNILPAARLTRPTMLPGHYMTARIDAPSLVDAQALTLRAKQLSSASQTLAGQYVWFDYSDPALPPPSHQWYWLHMAVVAELLSDLPWAESDLQGQSGPQDPWSDAFRFDTYKLYGWSAADFASDDPGGRVLAYDFNSFGAVTVRSTSAEAGLFVPNALAAGYAAAVGATGEPQCCVGVFPDTVLAALREGWTLGEAFYLANPYDDWMWTLVGDPLLTLPNWFNPTPSAPGTGDVNGDGVVNGLDIQPFIDVFTGANTDPEQRGRADLDGNGSVDLDDAFLFVAPLAFDTYDWNLLRGTGDASGDGVVDGADVDAFVDLLLHGTAGQPIRKAWAADMNRDGAITMDDLPLFVQALLRP